MDSYSEGFIICRNLPSTIWGLFFFCGVGWGVGELRFRIFQYENSIMTRRLFVQTSVGACHAKELNPDNAMYHFWYSPIHLAYRYVRSQRVQFLSCFGLK